ncbi:glycosyltransferase family 2 protein [Polaribacter sp. IC073]|uniref:glycosyltransferase family 2 protein n=1 Tax=Polaribacter sp. IC073 TaxID=2508540 RepID=UPI0011BE4643|nr:glycosyltransferase family 2 protein [Polaribacter sp. IC073]TXD49114.1 glycosyltransferase family 2 protein [Polaribacter sp. IC073]
MKPNQPLISVVLPVYNVERYVTETMDSILKQTIQDFEIIVIDDCSTDKTLDIIKSYNDERIKIYEKEENKGLVDSLNIGFKIAQGKYIARVDGDDVNALNRFEKQLNFLEANSCIAACGSWLKAFGANNVILKHKETHEEIQSHMLLSNAMSMGATMLRRKLYLGFDFDKTMQHVEDYDFWVRTIWSCKLHNLQEVLYYYRAHDEQVSYLFKQIQLKNDIIIKLNLFKKIKYNQNLYKDDFVIKIMFTNNYITVSELSFFFKFTNILLKNNNCFDSKYLEEVINKIRRQIVYNIYFTGIRKKIDKQWRIKALFVMPYKELTFIIKKKLIKFGVNAIKK